jgi:cyclopropane-fatty-acyl-phospholipid synthase
MRSRETLAGRIAATALLRQIRVGSLVVVDETTGGRPRRLTFGRGAPTATIELHDPGFWKALMRGSRGLADSYAAGLWDTPDLVAVIRLAARNAIVIDRVRQYTAPLWTPQQRLRAVLRRNNRRRRDIAAHYDLGNELVSRMLDPTMSYSCALFEREGMTLQEASIAKLERVCEQLELRAEDHVIEIGTGWGGFAEYAASTRGCRVTTTTISAEQHAYAVARVREAGLEDLVTVLRSDYRDLRGRYDKLVSIEMIEAVGWQHIGTFFARCSRLLHPEGVMLLQAITIDDRAYEVEKASKSFIKEYIFPGGCLPSLEVIQRNVARRTDLQTVGLHDLTASYVTTLRHWRENFLAHRAELEALGYDVSFRRVWTLYLAYCEAGFAERRICDVQLLLAKPRWTGAHPAAGARDARIAAASG